MSPLWTVVVSMFVRAHAASAPDLAVTISATLSKAGLASFETQPAKSGSLSGAIAARFVASRRPDRPG